MVRIEVSVQINASHDKVWDVVSDLDNEPKYWKGTKSIRNISKDDDKIIREITIAFKDKKCMQEITIDPKTRIFAQFTEGIIKGSKTISVSKDENNNDKTDTTTVCVIWDIKFAGLMGMFTGMVKKHIHNGTELALAAIKKEVEK
jgi:hypothetical protein